MQTTVTIDDKQLKSLMFHTHSNNESEAIYSYSSLFAAGKATARFISLAWTN